MTEKIATAVFILMFRFFIFIFLLPAVLFVLLSMTDVARWCSRLLHLYFDKDIRVGWSVVYLISVGIATSIEFGDRIKDQIRDRFSNVAPCPRCKRRALYIKDWVWVRFHPWRASEDLRPAWYYDKACVCRTENCGWEVTVR
jgi:hypothetical protein